MIRRVASGCRARCTASVAALMAVVGFALAQSAQPKPKAADGRAALTDPLAARPLNPNFDLYPDSSLVDFSPLLEAPAGKRGFVTASDDGHLKFSDGTRARFWGVVITQEHIDIPKRRIDEVVDVLARAGCNMVRFHSLDNRAGYEFGFVRRNIIDDAPPHERDTQHFDAEYRDRLDYWVARLKERGIYSFIVLRAFRHFREGDGLENAAALPRAARPMAFFNQRLIDLQIQFARDLLFSHKNPYTGMPLGQDPAVALIELFNEDSLFSRPALWHSMPQPYQSEFQALWMDYLKRSYGTTAKLAEAWTDADGRLGLQPGETLEAGNVALPDMNLNESFAAAQRADHADPARSPARRRDAIRFAVELQRNYFRQMTAALRDMGLKVPCTGVVSGAVIPDTFSVAQELGFTAENMYQEHPHFEPGREWLPPYYYSNQNYLREVSPHSGMPFITRYRWSGTPLAVREWATCWPNSARATSMLDMAAYGRLQDLDALLYFAYYTTGDFTRLGPFTLGNDPSRWGLFGLAAQVFLGADTVAPAQRTVQIAWSAEDMAAHGAWIESFHNLSYVHRVENTVLKPDGPPSAADLTILGGRSHAIGWRGERALIWSAADFVTAARRERATGEATVWARSGYKLDATATSGLTLRFNGIGFGDGETSRVQDTTVFPVEALRAARMHPIGVSPDKQWALGGYHEQRKNLVFGKLPPALLVRFALDLTNHWYDTPMTHVDLDRGVWRSDTGQLVRDTARGLLTVDAPSVQIIQGEFTTNTAVETPSGYLQAVSQSPLGVIAAVALDGKPLEDSQRYIIKMVTVARNRRETLVSATHPAMQGKWVMQVEGGAPIVTDGRPLEGRATVVALGGHEVVAAGLENGTWELLVDEAAKKAYLACDTPNALFRVSLPRGAAPASVLRMRRYQNETPVANEAEPVSGLFKYPGWAKYISLEF
jgi:hypothetical protein